MTVEEFFSKEYGVTLRYPNMPCLWVGSTNKRIYIPAEVCTVVKGQVNNHKLGPDQVRMTAYRRWLTASNTSKRHSLKETVHVRKICIFLISFK